MCGLDSTVATKPSYKVVLRSQDKTSGDNNSYTVPFPLVMNGRYRCTVRLLTSCSAGDAYTLYMRNACLNGMNRVSSLQTGYVPALTYSSLVAAEDVLYLDAAANVPI